MLSEAIAGAIVEAVFSHLLEQSEVGDRIRRRLGRDPQRIAFKKALQAAYDTFAAKYPDMASSLFDLHFLQYGAAPLLAGCLRPKHSPDATELARVWAKQLRKDTDPQFLSSILPAAADFLEILDAALRSEPEFYPLFSSQDQHDTKVATLQMREELTTLREEITKQAISQGAPPQPQGPPFHEGLLLPPTAFIGRTADLDWLLQQLRKAEKGSVLLVHGMGGVGKTTLAAVAVHQVHHEGRFVDGIAVNLCQGKTDAISILQEVLTAFDPLRRRPETNDATRLAEIAHQILDGKDALIVLDNIEPTLAVEQLMAPLRVSGVVLLLTMRQKPPLDVVPAKGCYELKLLSSQEALDLFTHAMGRGIPAPLTAAEFAAAERIVASLDRHTLAIKLAGMYAADVKRDLVTLATELEDPEQVLRLPQGETPEAVAHIFLQSIRMLPSAAQRLFAALSAYPTQACGRQAALALAQGLHLANAQAHLNLLIRRGLIEPFLDTQVPEGRDRERLRFHVLLWAFATTRFRRWKPQNQHAALRTIASYYVSYTKKANNVTLDPDEANITAVLEWAHQQAEHGLVAGLCSGMRNFWRDRWRIEASLRYLPWGIEAAEAVAQATQDRDDRLRVAYLALTYGQVLQNLGQLAQADEVFQQCRTLFEEDSDRRGVGAVLFQLGQTARTRNQWEKAEQYLQESLAIDREEGDRGNEGTVLSVLGQLAMMRGRFEQAEQYCQEALTLLHGTPEQENEGWVLQMLGQLAAMRGDLPTAARLFQEIAPGFKASYGAAGEATILSLLGQMALSQGQFDEAEQYLARGWSLAHQINDLRAEAASLVGLGMLAVARQQLDSAEESLQQAIGLTQQLQDPGQVEALRLFLARIAWGRGQLDETEKQFRQSLDILRELQHEAYPLAALDFGRFLIEERGSREEGCSLFAEAAEGYAAMELPDMADMARQTARQFGCGEEMNTASQLNS